MEAIKCQFWEVTSLVWGSTSLSDKAHFLSLNPWQRKQKSNLQTNVSTVRTLPRFLGTQREGDTLYFYFWPSLRCGIQLVEASTSGDKPLRISQIPGLLDILPACLPDRKWKETMETKETKCPTLSRSSTRSANRSSMSRMPPSVYSRWWVFMGAWPCWHTDTHGHTQISHVYFIHL